MSRSKWLSTFALVASLSVCGAAANGQTLYEGARLITGDGSVIENSAFVVQGTLFSQVGRKGEVPLPAGGTRVDLTGKTVMPTLVDMHGHYGFQNLAKGMMSKESFTRANLIDHMQRLAYFGVGAVVGVGDLVDRSDMHGGRTGWGDAPLKVRDDAVPGAALFKTAGPGLAWPGSGAQGPPSRVDVSYPVSTVAEARAAVEAAAAENERARKDYERAQVLYKQDDISTSQFDQYRARSESASAALRQAQERLKLVEAGPRQEAIDAARAQVNHSAAAVKWAEAQRLDITRKQQDLLSRRAEVERARAQVGLIDSQIADTEVVSPIDGVVLVKSANTGEILAPGTTVVTIGDIEHPWLRGYINERDLGRVKLGTKAKISTDSYPGKVYWGRVSFIASEAEFTPKQIQTSEERLKLVYRIKIDVDNPQHELKSNMPADAELVLD